MAHAASITVLLMLAGLDGARAAHRTPNPTTIGGVLTGVGYIDRSRPFIDLMKQTLGFSSLSNPTDQNATTGTDKWPTQVSAQSRLCGDHEWL